jgi:anaerobic selenocysteine-containing dehydrogenase
MFVRRYGKACVERAGVTNAGAGLGEALFQRILHSPSAALMSVHEYDDTWKFIQHADGKIHLAIPPMLDEIKHLSPAEPEAEFPMILQAGERRSYNANTIYRETAWRKRDAEGALKVHPLDAERLSLVDGGHAWCESRRAAVCARVMITDEIRPGLVSLPHGYGMFEENDPASSRNGPPINFLTESSHCDPLSKVPFHKHVYVRVSPVGPDEQAAVGDIRETAVAATT